MPFIISWTDSAGAQQVVLDTPFEAFHELKSLAQKKVVNISIKDDAGRPLSPEDLFELLPPGSIRKSA